MVFQDRGAKKNEMENVWQSLAHRFDIIALITAQNPARSMVVLYSCRHQPRRRRLRPRLRPGRRSLRRGRSRKIRPPPPRAGNAAPEDIISTYFQCVETELEAVHICWSCFHLHAFVSIARYVIHVRCDINTVIAPKVTVATKETRICNGP